jgi:hypothetical protein
MDKEDYEIVRLLEIEHQTKANEPKSERLLVA